eukprot:GHVN01052352.1.p1 GENE.GHVN01052352.1~~GHVN01052352.1.p1  ORF type:complete len:1282 (+),score=141.30 GHVN01052352.1:118-3846(+)
MGKRRRLDVLGSDSFSATTIGDIRLLRRDAVFIYGETLSLFVKKRQWKKEYEFSIEQGFLSILREPITVFLHRTRKTSVFVLHNKRIYRRVFHHPAPIAAVSWSEEDAALLVATLADGAALVYKKTADGRLRVCGAMEVGPCKPKCSGCVVWAKKGPVVSSKNESLFFLSKPKTEPAFFLEKYNCFFLHLCQGCVVLWGATNVHSEKNILKTTPIIKTEHISVEVGFNVFSGLFSVKQAFIAQKRSSVLLAANGSVFLFEFKLGELLLGRLVLREVYCWKEATGSMRRVGSGLVVEQDKKKTGVYSAKDGRPMLLKNFGGSFVFCGDMALVLLTGQKIDVFDIRDSVMAIKKSIDVSIDFGGIKEDIEMTAALLGDRMCLCLFTRKKTVFYSVIIATWTHTSTSSSLSLSGDPTPIYPGACRPPTDLLGKTPFAFGYTAGTSEEHKISILWCDGDGLVEEITRSTLRPVLVHFLQSGVFVVSDTISIAIHSPKSPSETIRPPGIVESLVCGEIKRRLHVSYIEGGYLHVYRRGEGRLSFVLKMAVPASAIVTSFGAERIFFSQGSCVFEALIPVENELQLYGKDRDGGIIFHLFEPKDELSPHTLYSKIDKKTEMAHYLALVSGEEACSPESWNEFVSLGCVFWMNGPQIREAMPKIAACEYREQRLFFACLLYAAIGKLHVAMRLLAVSKDSIAQKMVIILEGNLDSDEGRRVGIKNAFALLRRQEYVPAAVLFLACGLVQDACFLCQTHVGDIQLALLILVYIPEACLWRRVITAGLKGGCSFWRSALLRRLLSQGEHEPPEVLLGGVEETENTMEGVLGVLVYFMEKAAGDMLSTRERGSAFWALSMLGDGGYRKYIHGLLTGVFLTRGRAISDVLTLEEIRVIGDAAEEREDDKQPRKEKTMIRQKDDIQHLSEDFSLLLGCGDENVISFKRWNDNVFCATRNSVFEFVVSKEHYCRIESTRNVYGKIVFKENRMEGEQRPKNLYRRESACLAMDIHATEPLYFTFEHGRGGVLMSRFGKTEPVSFFSQPRHSSMLIPRISGCGTALGIGEKEGAFSVWMLGRHETPLDIYQCSHRFADDFLFFHSLFLCSGRLPNYVSLYDRLLPRRAALVAHTKNARGNIRHLSKHPGDEKLFFAHEKKRLLLYDIRRMEVPVLEKEIEEGITTLHLSDADAFLGTESGSVYSLDMRALELKNKRCFFKEVQGVEKPLQIKHIDVLDEFIYLCTDENGIRRVSMGK